VVNTSHTKCYEENDLIEKLWNIMTDIIHLYNLTYYVNFVDFILEVQENKRRRKAKR